MPLGNLWGFTSSGKKIRVGGIRYVPTSLLISGSWENTQYVGSPVDYTGLTFTVTSAEGITETVTPTSVSPSVWGAVGTQTATFTYTEASGTVTATKSANVTVIHAVTVTLTNGPYPGSPTTYTNTNGAGTYFDDDTCTITLPLTYNYYSLSYITNNGTIVNYSSLSSSSSGYTYTFTVGGNTEIVAHYTKQGGAHSGGMS